MVYPITKRTLGLYFKLYVKKISGIENLPKKGPFIIASNQESNIDPFLLIPFILSKLNRKIYFLAKFWSRERNVGLLSKVTLFTTKPLLINWLGCIPALKKGGTVDVCVSLLKKGKIIGIFPEGRRNPEKILLMAKTGVARIALLAKVPVIPVGIINSYKILPIGAIVPRFKRAIIKIGKPMYFDKYYSKKDNRKTLEKVTDKIMGEISKLCKKKYPQRT